MLEIFHNPNFDFLGKKMIFLGLSALLIAVGMASLWQKGGLKLGIDFKGGTHIDVKFAEAPDIDKIRDVLRARGQGSSTIQRLGPAGNNEIKIASEQVSEGEGAEDLDATRLALVTALEGIYGAAGEGFDLNSSSADSIRDYLMRLDPLGLATTPSEAQTRYTEIAGVLTANRDNVHGGLWKSFDDLKEIEGVPAAVAGRLEDAQLTTFVVRSVAIVGPRVGQQLRQKAVWATVMALGGMLLYIGFRFQEWVYGTAAVVAVFHDVLITLGLISLFDYEFDLNTVAALLTLVGYSVNDTIVTFDRIRENKRLLRKDSFANLVNLSINQTLSRTVLTSGLTLVTVMALFFLGGEVLHGFAFTLVAGVLVGTYSSIFVASPIVVGWVSRKSKA